jgi:hypothetical protein
MCVMSTSKRQHITKQSLKQEPRFVQHYNIIWQYSICTQSYR